MSASGISPFIEGWLASESADFDKISVKRSYIDINDGNFYDGLMFSQIMYWHGRNLETGKLRLSVQKEGFYWLAKAYGDWWEECRICERTAKNCTPRLRSRGLIITKVFKFQGKRTLHIRIDWDAFEAAIRRLSEGKENENLAKYRKGTLQSTGKVFSSTETTSREELINLDLKHKDKQVVGRSGDPTIALPDFLISNSENFPESDEEVKTQSSIPVKNSDTAKSGNEIKTTPHSPPSPRAKVKRIDRDVEMQIEVKVRKPPQATKIIFKENDFGWLQMPSIKVFKLARRVTTRRLQNQMAPLFSNIKWNKSDRGELILVNAKDDSPIDPESFEASEWLDLASLRDQLLEKELLSQDDFNELLEAIFIDSVKWCKKMGTIALKTIEPENAIANLFAQTDRNLLASIRGN